MLGFLTPKRKPEEDRDADNHDVARLFFDSFSKRVGSVEENMRTILLEFDKLKASVERGQISDLVLLDRLQRAEALIKESLSSIKSAVEKDSLTKDEYPVNTIGASLMAGPSPTPIEAPGPQRIASHVLSPTGELESLPSVTTPTELQMLTLLANEGPKSAPEIGKAVGRSREHTARLMKKLFEEGYTRRDQTRIPFRYSLVDRLKQTVKKSEVKGAEKEPISVPQT